jgi:tape measure domain-containing protein
MADVNIAVQVATRGATNQLKKLEGRFSKLGGEAEKLGTGSEKGFALMSSGAAAAAVAVVAVGTAVLSAVNQASKLQDLETQFIAFTGSAEAAATQVERIAEFSGQTPFQLEELVTANRTLLAFGSSTEESLEQLKQLGEAASGTGNSVSELAQIFGQIQAAGKLTGERFNQLAERGVNLGPALAEGLGVAESELEDLRRKGKITSEDVKRAFETMTTGSGQFAGSMDRLSKTFSGATSTLKDNLSLLAGDIGKRLLPAFTKITTEATKGVQALREFLNSKPEKLRVLNNELKDLQEELQNINKGETGFLGFFQLSAEESTKRAAELEKQIASLKNEIVDVSTGVKKPEDIATLGKPKEESPVESASTEVSEAEKIAAELEAINAQKQANEQARRVATNQAIAEQLDAQREIILQKETEKDIALLEAQGLFEQAQLLQAETQAAALIEIEKRKQDEAAAIGKKARADEFNFQKKNAEARKKFEEQTWAQRAQTAQAGLSALASLQSSGSKEAFEIGKAAAIAQALVSIPSTAIKAYDSLAGIPYVGPALGAAAAAAAIAAGTAQINKIRSSKFTGFADGGLVEGGIPGVDSVPALLTPGEVVVPQKNFESMKIENAAQVEILMMIKRTLEAQTPILESILATQSNDEEQSLTPINVELTLDGQVLANQILELSQDNARIA